MAAKTKRNTRRIDHAAAFAEAAECLKALAHPVRLQMVHMLLAGRYTVGELAAECGVPDNVASEHLRLMQRCGFFTSEREGRRVSNARVALGAAAPTPLRALAAEKILQGGEGGPALWAEAAAEAAGEIRPISDIRSSEAYRRRVAAVLVREALEEAWRRAGG